MLRDTVVAGGLALFDGETADGALAIPFTKTAREVAQSALMANTVAAGAVFALLGYPVERLCDYLTTQFQRKGAEVIAANRRCAERGAELALATGKRLAGPVAGGSAHHPDAGADAIALGAATAGVKFVSAYPMSPGTATFAALAGLADQYGIVVEQAEDEIAAINMVIGATYAGAPAAHHHQRRRLRPDGRGDLAGGHHGTARGGGAGAAARPGDRHAHAHGAAGPALRRCTRDMASSSRPSTRPARVQQCYEITRHAIAQAHAYQTPVIILTDQYLQDADEEYPGA